MAKVFVRHGSFTFGGGAVIMLALHREALERRGWIDEDDFGLCFALARLTPGTTVLAFCAGIGLRMRGLSGAMVALLASSLPCAVMVIAATALFAFWQDNHWVQAAIHGAIAAAVALTVWGVWSIASPYLKGPTLYRALLIAATAFLLFQVVGLSPIQVILTAAVGGALFPPKATPTADGVA